MVYCNPHITNCVGCNTTHIPETTSFFHCSCESYVASKIFFGMEIYIEPYDPPKRLSSGISRLANRDEKLEGHRKTL